MAVELDHFLTEQLARLPEDHPDRPFVAALAQTVVAFVARTTPTAVVELWPTPPEAELLTPPPTETDDSTPVQVADAEQTTESAERERVVLRGRLGKRVRFSTTPRGVPRAEFNLATHHEDAATGGEVTVWRTVLAFRAVADALAHAQPHQGQYAEVIGYRQTDQRRSKDGQAKTVERVIAAKIRLS
jgi:primosomal replication protein N